MPGTMRVAPIEAGVVVLVEGKGTLQISPLLESFAQSCLEEGHSRFVLDLSQCPYLDSTFLGCLLGIHRRFLSAGRDFKIVADAAQRRNLLATSMLDRVLSCQDQAPAPAGSFETLPSEQFEAQDLGRHAAASHHRLAELGGPNARCFAEIAQRLKQESE